jgi:hypothetical protein
MSKSERRIFKSPVDLQSADIRALYDGFIAPIATLDCGQKCAPNNSNGKPFCCDICHAVPAAYTSEWDYLRTNTNLWHAWREDECAHSGSIEAGEDAPEGMLFLACLGPTQCQRDFRALSCRQFPFFPYVTSDYRFVGLAAEWVFEPVCWVLSNLGFVSNIYREQFMRTYDYLFALFQDEFDNYAYHSELLRANYSQKKRRFPLLHRNGRYYLVSPISERMQPVAQASLPRFGSYK